MATYLSVLKKSLFKFSEQKPTPIQDEKSSTDKDLKEDWIYIHDEDNSQTEELLDLNDSSEFSVTNQFCNQNGLNSSSNNCLKSKMTNLSTFEQEQKAKEIINNRNAWIKKRNKQIALQKKNNSNSSGLRSKVMKRKRNNNSTSSSTNSSNNLYISNLFEENSRLNQNYQHNLSTESVDNNCTNPNPSNQETNGNVSIGSPGLTYNLRSKVNKRPKFQNKNRCKPCNKVKTLNQPMAKGMC